MSDDGWEINPPDHPFLAGCRCAGGLIRALFAFFGGAAFPDMRNGAAGVAHRALICYEAVFDSVRGVACLDFTAGLQSGNRRGAGRCVESRRQPFPGIGEGTGGTEADKECDGEDGEFRFHGWDLVRLGTP